MRMYRNKFKYEYNNFYYGNYDIKEVNLKGY